MPNELVVRSIFDRLERVWHNEEYELVPSCMRQNYVQHDGGAGSIFTREEYAAEISKIRQSRPDLRVVIYDHSVHQSRAWFRFAFKWAEVGSPELRSQAGIKVFRIEAGKIAESWLTMLPLGSSWPDSAHQEHWTTPT